jgi:hypothetical protein
LPKSMLTTDTQRRVKARRNPLPTTSAPVLHRRWKEIKRNQTRTESSSLPQVWSNACSKIPAPLWPTVRSLFACRQDFVLSLRACVVASYCGFCP